jgi:hypothetical protein
LPAAILGGPAGAPAAAAAPSGDGGAAVSAAVQPMPAEASPTTSTTVSPTGAVVSDGGAPASVADSAAITVVVGAVADNALVADPALLTTEAELVAYLERAVFSAAPPRKSAAGESSGDGRLRVHPGTVRRHDVVLAALSTAAAAGTPYTLVMGFGTRGQAVAAGGARRSRGDTAAGAGLAPQADRVPAAVDAAAMGDAPASPTAVAVPRFLSAPVLVSAKGAAPSPGVGIAVARHVSFPATVDRGVSAAASSTTSALSRTGSFALGLSLGARLARHSSFDRDGSQAGGGQGASPLGALFDAVYARLPRRTGLLVLQPALRV